jgi:hypothetical protein
VPATIVASDARSGDCRTILRKHAISEAERWRPRRLARRRLAAAARRSRGTCSQTVEAGSAVPTA